MASRLGNSFSQHFNIPSKWLKSNGILNVTLDLDTNLFIDPFLLPHSKHKEFAKCAFDTYIEHFNVIHRLLTASQCEGDKPWKAATKLLKYKEIPGTCIGYSKHSTRGSGFGVKLSNETAKAAKQVIDLGVKDPELFSLLSLFEEGIGPDLISDMVTNITLPCILKFNKRIYNEIEKDTGVIVPLVKHKIRDLEVNLPRNTYDNNGSPIILLPTDILENLPLLNDIRDIPKIAASNEELREKTNKNIQSIWKIKTKKDKEFVKSQALESAGAFQTLLDLVKLLEMEPYDFHKDPQGLLVWRSASQNFSALNKIDIEVNKKLSKTDQINEVCIQIINQFQHLIENGRLNRLFWVDYNPRPERFAQMLFFGIAAAYCDANNLDISPEADAGAGPVDFKFSDGSAKVVVEMKLSTNTQVVKGYQKQLDAYMKAEQTHIGHYVMIDVGKIGEKWDRVKDIRNNNAEFKKNRHIHLIDGSLKKSASKL